MLSFAKEYKCNRTYKGVVLNRARHNTQSKEQSRIDNFVRPTKRGEVEAAEIKASLFHSFDFYISYVKESLLQRFGPLNKDPLCWFSIFDNSYNLSIKNKQKFLNFSLTCGTSIKGRSI